MPLRTLDSRNRQPEVMDQPDLDAARFVGSLRGLRRVNIFSNTAAILWPSIRSLAQQSDKPLRVLDVATGGGDVPIALWKRARREGCQLEIHACDVNPLAVDFANEQAAIAGAKVRVHQWDATRDAIDPSYDVITSSLFLHHLDEKDAVGFLSRSAQSARRMVLISDIERCRAGYLLAYYGVRILSRNDVMHTDGPRSVEGAFTRSEAEALAQAAGWSDCRIAPKWPFRYLLEWRAP